MKEITNKHIKTNVHPEYRAIGLSHIRQVRRMLREGRYTGDCRRIIKEAQADLAASRRRLANA